MIKENIIKNINNTKNKIKSLDFDAHWYRRVFHAFGAAFVVYYMLPDINWINILKLYVPPAIVLIAILLEILRIKGYLSSDHFFGLRMYEQKRPGSYVFFAVGILLLIIFFPQQIAIPCVLCACLGDPIIGELRNRLNKKYAISIGLIVCMFLFMIAWYKSSIYLFFLVSIIGAFGAVVGETKKFWFIDDDFMIQILPAILVGIIWILIPYLGLSYPDPVIYPFTWPW